MHPRLVLAIGVAISVLGACSNAASPSPSLVGGGSASVIPVLVSSEIVVGSNRVLFSFLGADTNAPAAAPDRTASFAFFAADRPTGPPSATAEGRFVWGIEGERGLYVVLATFPTAGDWIAEVATSAPGASTETARLEFQVHDDGSAVRVGEKAPSSDTPTADDVGGDLAKLSTDQRPDPSFYEVSVAAAIADARPFVLVFATPAFCTSRQCGPTLDTVKSLAADFADVAFINVEPFELQYAEGRLQPVLDAQGQLQPVAAVKEWGILSEPWIFVVDGKGIVRGSFEGVVGADELREAVEEVG